MNLLRQNAGIMNINKMKLNKMKPYLTIALILVFIATTAISCPVSKKEDSTVHFFDVRKGSEALEAEIIKGFSEEIPEEHPFIIMLELHNNGASHIGRIDDKEVSEEELRIIREAEERYGLQEIPGKIVIQTDGKVKFTAQGSAEIKLEGDALQDSFELMGKSQRNPNGGKDLLTYNLQSQEVRLEEYVESEVKAKFCYQYHTYAVADVCIDPRQYDKTSLGPEVCEAEETALSGGQGGPVAVAKIVPSFRYKDENTVEPTFIITIEKIGKGEVFKATNKAGVIDIGYGCGILEKTPEDEKIRRWNTVKAYAKLATQQKPLNCIAKGYVDVEKPEVMPLVDGKGEITCKGDPINKNQAAYTTPLFVHIIYGHAVSEETTIRVFNANLQEELTENKQ